MAGRQQTAPPQHRSSKDATAHPHQPGARPDPQHPDRAHSRRHHPAKAKVKFPLRNRIFFSIIDYSYCKNRPNNRFVSSQTTQNSFFFSNENKKNELKNHFVRKKMSMKKHIGEK
jgi:hypothetical protein